MAILKMAAYVVNGSYTCICFANTVHITFAEGNTAKLAIIGESQKGIMLCPKEEQIKDGEQLKLAKKSWGQSRS